MLARDLAHQFEAPLVEEYGRDYFARKLAQGDATVFPGDLVRVIGEQSRREDVVAAENPPMMVCDTDVFTVAVWHERYLGGRRPEIELLAQMRYDEGAGMDLYLLCAPDFPFVPDEVRTGEPLRTAMHGVFRARLIEMGYPYIEVGGPHADRLSKAVAEIQRLLLARE